MCADAQHDTLKIGALVISKAATTETSSWKEIVNAGDFKNVDELESNHHAAGLPADHIPVGLDRIDRANWRNAGADRPADADRALAR